MAGLDRDSVAAIVVSRPESPYLARTLTALGAQSVALDEIHVVTPRGDEPMARGGGRVDPDLMRRVVRHESPARTLGAAVNDVLKNSSEATWLWVLHDDAAPTPDALDLLLRAGETAPAVGAVGMKQVAWDDPANLLEVGIRATRSGRRVPEIEEGDRDGGQLDRRSDVLAVGTAGVLLRREALEAVGGFDPYLGPFGDGLELGRRLRAGGWHVIVEPRAVVAHRRASFTPRHSFGRRRGAQLYNALLAAPAPVVPLAFIGYLLLAPVRAVARLLTKEPALAAGELGGGWRLLTSVRLIGAGRRRLRRAERAGSRSVGSRDTDTGRTVGRAALAPLEDSASAVRRARREQRRVRRESTVLGAQPDPLELAARARWRAQTRRGGLLAVLIAGVAAVVGTVHLYGASRVTGGALLADSATFPELLREASHLWLASGDGMPGRVDALWVMLSPLLAVGTPFGWTLGGMATLILYCALPLAALCAFMAAGVFTHSPHVRAAAALLWAFAPPLLGACQAGYVAPAIFHILLPLELAALVSAWRASSRRAAGASQPRTVSLGVAALVGAYLAACAPVVLVILVIGALVGALRFRRWRWWWIAVPAWVLVAPALGTSWRVLFATPGATIGVTPSFWQLLALQPVSTTSIAGSRAHLVAVVIAGAILLVAIAALLRRGHWRGIRAGWLLAAGGLGWAVASRAVSVGATPESYGTVGASAWTGIGLSVAAGGLWMAIACGGDGLRTDLRNHAFGFRHLGAGLMALVGGIAVVGSGALFAAGMATGAAAFGASASPIPAIAAAEQSTNQRARVLVLTEAAHGIHAEVWREDGPQLTEATMASAAATADALAQGAPRSDEASAQLASATMDLLAGVTDAADAIGQHGISVILVPAGESSSLAAGLNAAGGLQYVTANSTGAFWRVSPVSATRPARLTLNGQVIDSGRVGAETTIPAGMDGALWLAERASSGWEATLDGQPLQVRESTWNQEWDVPAHASAAQLSIRYRPLQAGLLDVAQLLAGGAAVVAAIPMRRGKVSD